MLNINMYFMRAPVKTTNGKYPDRHRAENFWASRNAAERIPELAMGEETLPEEEKEKDRSWCEAFRGRLRNRETQGRAIESSRIGN